MEFHREKNCVIAHLIAQKTQLMARIACGAAINGRVREMGRVIAQLVQLIRCASDAKNGIAPVACFIIRN